MVVMITEPPQGGKLKTEGEKSKNRKLPDT